MHDLLARFWHFVGNIDECRMREKEKNFALSEEKRKLFEQFDKNQKNNIYKEKILSKISPHPPRDLFEDS